MQIETLVKVKDAESKQHKHILTPLIYLKGRD